MIVPAALASSLAHGTLFKKDGQGCGSHGLRLHAKIVNFYNHIQAGRTSIFHVLRPSTALNKDLLLLDLGYRPFRFPKLTD